MLGGANQQHCGLFNSARKRWWVGYSGKMLTGTSIHIESRVETWSRWEQIKIWMMFSKKQRINCRSAYTILDKVSSNSVLWKKDNPSWEICQWLFFVKCWNGQGLAVLNKCILKLLQRHLVLLSLMTSFSYCLLYMIYMWEERIMSGQFTSRGPP